MTVVECLAGHKHFSVWAMGLGAVNFLQNKYHVLHVAVQKSKELIPLK